MRNVNNIAVKCVLEI